ncbi:MAG: TonB-dependent receptor [Pseudomonadota bacterium]|nr:TonB-dependent receptor [Pseudomonadota bacterium]
MAHRKLQHQTLAAAVFAACLSMSMTAQAQQAAPQQATAAEPDDEETVTLATMTVTAQKREEALQDVPISVTVLDQQLLQDTGVYDIKDLQALVPGLTVTSTQSEAITTARIRGIGTVGDNVGLESSVGIVIDGVYRPRNSVGFGDLGQIERIEVLKGPQGTVFGKNTSAGVINVVTRRPSYVQSVEAELTAGNYGAFGASASYNDALGDAAAFSIYAAKRKRDGWMDVRSGNGPRAEDQDYDQNYHTLRGKFLFEPGDTLEILLSGDFTSREENCCTAVQTTVGATAGILNALVGGKAIGAPGDDPFDRVAYSNRPTTQDIKDQGVSAEVNWETPWMGGATLTSITASRDWEAINGLDYDFSTADILYRNPDEDESFTGFKTFSQEFRLTGATDRVDWMVGFFYSDEDLDRTETYRIGPHYEPYLSIALLSLVNPALGQLPNAPTFLADATGRTFGTVFAGLGAHDRYEQNAKSAALFTNNTWHATDALDLTMGLRYTRDEKTVDSWYSNPNGSPGCAAMLDPVNGQARIAAALMARGVPAAALPQVIPQVIGYGCLPWANPMHVMRRDADGNLIGGHTRQSNEEKEWSGTLKAAYRWNENVMTYLSGARGYKGGGFNLDRVQSATGLSSGGAGILPVNDTEFAGEFVDSYELGMKTTWNDGSLLLNATLFHQQYEDFQLNSFLGTSFVVRSIPEVTSKGVDAEILWQPASVRGLMLQGGLMYAETTFGDDIPGGDFAAPGGGLYKLPGATMPFAPDLSGSASLTYEWGLSSGLQARFNIGGKYMAGYNTGSDLDVEKYQDAYTVFNARVGLGAANGRWTVELWASNLTDAEYVQVGFDGPLQNVSPQPNNPFNTFNAFPGAPRMYGATLRVSY